MAKDYHTEGRESLEQAMRTLTGRRAIKYLFSLCPMFDLNHSGDPYKDAFVNGQRSMGLTLLNTLSPEDRALILKELLCQKK